MFTILESRPHIKEWISFLSVAIFLISSFVNLALAATNQPGGLPNPLGITDLSTMIAALRSNLPHVVRLIVAIAYVMGLWMIYTSLYTLKIYGDLRTMMSSQAGLSGPLIKLVLGVFLLLMPGIVKVGIYSLWGTGYSILDYPEPITIWSSWQPVINGVLDVVRVFGYIAFLRGFVMLGRATRQGAPQGLNGKGLIHIVGGILAINIIGTVEIIRHTFGFV
jgi:intracellular multiplication protein IcmC